MSKAFLKCGYVTIVLLLIMIMVSCQLTTDSSDIAPTSDSVIYTIKKGEHSSFNSTFKKVEVEKLRFQVTFDESAVYTTVNPENQQDINKLYGVSDCNSQHHSNSARFGWRWLNNQLELHAYTYVGKARKSEFITSVAIGKAIQCELILDNGKYIFVVDGKQVTLPRGCNGKTQGYQLYPYFGGDEVAPHDINITIKELL